MCSRGELNQGHNDWWVSGRVLLRVSVGLVLACDDVFYLALSTDTTNYSRSTRTIFEKDLTKPSHLALRTAILLVA